MPGFADLFVQVYKKFENLKNAPALEYHTATGMTIRVQEGEDTDRLTSKPSINVLNGRRYAIDGPIGSGEYPIDGTLNPINNNTDISFPVDTNVMFPPWLIDRMAKLLHNERVDQDSMFLAYPATSFKKRPKSKKKSWLLFPGCI